MNVSFRVLGIFFFSYGRALRHKSYSGGCFGRALVVVFVVDVFLHFISLLEVKDSRRRREDYFFFFCVWRLPAAGFREKALTFTRPLRPPSSSSSSYSNWKSFIFLFVSVFFKEEEEAHAQAETRVRDRQQSHMSSALQQLGARFSPAPRPDEGPTATKGRRGSRGG